MVKKLSTFPLADLDPILLEMVIAKLKCKSYFRLQQTCRGMRDFVRRSRRISIGLDCLYSRAFLNKPTPEEASMADYGYDAPYGELCCYYESFHWCQNINPDDLYGTRLFELDINEEDDFKHFYDKFNKYRLTFESVNIVRCNWTKEETQTLLKMTKPVAVHLSSNGSDRYEALFQIKSLEVIVVDLDPADVPSVVPKLLRTFPEVKINIGISGVQVDLLHTLLQFLTQPFPNLRRFGFRALGNRSMTRAEFREEFRAYNLRFKSIDRLHQNRIKAVVKMPHQRRGISCKVTVSPNSVELYCGGQIVDNWSRAIY